MNFTQADIDSLTIAQENDSLTVFVGAGFSKFSETDTIKFPSWEELIGTLKSELNTSETDYLKVAQLYYLEFGEYKLYQKLREFIPLHATPSNFHIKLFKILQPKYVITTNWDNLLEKTISENGLIYDVVKTESDLVKSILPNKLIKIHGDFESHNIIFKEDDYLKYSINNPLFDNFLKHILSTTTVLFLGYSYNDSDLKQITKWIEKNSKISPPRFLLNTKIESSQKKYLENHGVKYLETEFKYTTYKELYDNFFVSVEKTINGEFFPQEELSDENVIAYFYNKITGLNELNTLVPEQITNIFSNCTIKYHHNCFGLEFHSKALTMDHDDNVRKIYARFFDIIKDEDNLKSFKDKLNYIFSSFISSGVVFIENNEFTFNIIEIFKSSRFDDDFDEEKDSFSKFISFSSKMPKYNFNIITCHNKSKDEQLAIFRQLSSETTEKLVKKQYLSAMISKFNKSVFAYNLLNDYRLINEIEEDLMKELRKESLYEFTNELINNKYPAKSKKHLQPLIEILNFKSIYKFYYDSTIDNSNFLKSAKNNKNGGFSFSNKEQRSNDRLIQFLRFCANNDIVLDRYTEFRDLMVSYATGKIEISKVNEKFKFSIYDLFIIIKYFKFKDIWSVFIENILPFVKESLDEGSGERILHFTENEKKYIEVVFNNLSELFIKHAHSFYSNDISNSFLNLMLVLGLINWSADELNNFINKIKNVLLKADIPYDCMRSVNYFTIIQYKLYKVNNEKFLELIDVVLEGFVSGKFRIPFYQNINHDLSYVYLYSAVNKIPYSNKNLVDKAIFSLKRDFEFDKRVQRLFSQKFLLPIYQVSNDEIKGGFIHYFDELRIDNWDIVDEELYEEIFRELDFLQYGCQVRDLFISFLTNWINNTFDKNVMSSLDFLKAGGIEKLLEIVNFLIQEKKLNQFSEIYSQLQNKKQNFSREV